MTANRQINIYIVGASCTGKTTLINALQEHYAKAQSSGGEGPPPGFIREVARNVLKQLDFERTEFVTSPDRSFELQKAILEGQFQSEASSRHGWYISDRSGLDPVVYTGIFAGLAKQKQIMASPQWKALERKMKDAVVCLCEAANPWLQDDGTRWLPQDQEEWLRHDAEFRRMLKTTEIPYTVVPRDMLDLRERVELVVSTRRKRATTACLAVARIVKPVLARVADPEKLENDGDLVESRKGCPNMQPAQP